jgi:hypothetical protein
VCWTNSQKHIGFDHYREGRGLGLSCRQFKGFFDWPKPVFKMQRHLRMCAF